MEQKNIWTVAITNERIHKETYQLISKAKALTGYDERLIHINIGKLSEDDKEKIYCCGANHLIHCLCEIEGFVKYEDILYEIYKKYKPQLVLFIANVKEKDCAAKFAIKIKAGLTADCINVIKDQNGNFVFTRTAMSDSVIAEIICMNTETSMCTVKGNIFESNFNYDSERIYEAIELGKQYIDSNLQVVGDIVSNVMALKKKVDFSKTKIVFGIGRGVRDEKTRKLIQEIAEKLHAEIAGTRAVVENGLIEKERQIGQSGISIRPEIYIACGISGAIQHIVGITKANTIIAINKDKKAPIFNYADYVIIGDCFEILNEFNLKMQSV